MLGSHTTPRTSYPVEQSAAYLTWLQNRAGGEQICNTLCIRKSLYGKGLYATEYIQRDDVIMRIPRIAQLSPRITRLSPHTLRDPHIDNLMMRADISSTFKLAVVILYEKKIAGLQSIWATLFTGMPPPEALITTLYWSDDELRMIEPSSVYPETARRKIAIGEAFTKIKEILQDIESDFPFDLEECKHAYSIVKSRGFIDNDGGAVLVPYADLMNHDSISLPIIWTADGYAEVMADRHYSVGEEVLISYGKKSNSTLLLNYGFTVRSNPEYFVVIVMTLNEDDILYTKKLEILKNQRFPSPDVENELSPRWNHFKLYKVKGSCKYGDGIPLLLRAFARISVIDDETLLESLEEAGKVDGRVCRQPLRTKRSEMEAHQVLRRNISEMLKIRSDLVMYKIPNMYGLSESSAVKRMLAIDLLQGEIEVLKAAQDWITRYCNQLCKRG